MKFIRSIENMMRAVVGEMLSIECGKKIFENGELLATASHQTYPDIQHEGVRTIIKGNFGMIYIPIFNNRFMNLSVRSWVTELKQTVNQMRSESLDLLKKYGRLDSYECINTGEEGFTLTRARKYCSETDTIIITNTNTIHVSGCERVLWMPAYVRISTIGGSVAKNRFTWIIQNTDTLIDSVCTTSCSPDPLYSMLSYLSICCDPDRVFKTADTVNRDLTATDLQGINNIVPIHSFGIIDNQLLKMMVSCQKGEMQKRTEVRKKLSKLLCNSNVIRNFRHMPTKSYSNYFPVMGNFVIKYNKKTKGAVELIRQLGCWSIYQNYFESRHPDAILRMKTPKPQGSVNFSMVEIDNSVFPQSHGWNQNSDPETDPETVPNDRCWHCHTPLYDSIYMAFDKNQPELNKGIAICNVCAHCKFNARGFYNNPAFDHSLFTTEMNVAKVEYPRSWKTVVEMVVNEDVQEIISGMFENTRCINNLLDDLVVITTDKKTYIGFTSIYKIYSFQRSHAAAQYPGIVEIINHPNTVLIPLRIC